MKPATEDQIRKQLIQDLLSKRWAALPAGGSALHVTELDIQSSRADLMQISREAHIGFEIKSGRDNLAKLEHQVPAYELCCDQCYLVYDRKHKVPDLPPHWGLISAETEDDGSVWLELEKIAGRNPMDDRRRLIRVCGQLWADEIKAALKSLGKRGWSKNRKFKNIRWLCEVAPHKVRPFVYQFMRERGDWRSKRRE
jgi:hypothetical protein